jgi:hypothetical protein
MRKSKKVFACLLIGIGILALPFSLIKGFPAAFIVSAGSALIAYGIVDFLFEHFVHKIGCARIMDEDERNVLINGKAYTLVSEFANIGFIVLALYSAICKADMAGCMIAISIFLLSQVVYVVCFKYFDRH